MVSLALAIRGTAERKLEVQWLCLAELVAWVPSARPCLYMVCCSHARQQVPGPELQAVLPWPMPWHGAAALLPAGRLRMEVSSLRVLGGCKSEIKAVGWFWLLRGGSCAMLLVSAGICGCSLGCGGVFLSASLFA